MALAWFLNEVWPRLGKSKLHVIAGRNPEYYIDFYKERVQLNLNQPGIELESFVSDVRPAYAKAEIVIAPLLASAGTNIKIMEAMACGKAIVSTPGGVNGLSVQPGKDFVLALTAEGFATAIDELKTKLPFRQEIERQARQTACDRYDWESIGRKQALLYQSLRSK